MKPRIYIISKRFRLSMLITHNFGIEWGDGADSGLSFETIPAAMSCIGIATFERERRDIMNARIDMAGLSA